MDVAVPADLEAGRRRARWAAAAAGALAAVVGTITYVGWTLGAELLTSYVRGLPTQKPATAVLALLTGAALVLRVLGPRRSALDRLGAACAVACLGLCAVVLVERLAGVDTGLGWYGGVYRGLPVLQTVVAYGLLGAGLLTLHAGGRLAALLGQTAGVGAVAIGVLALLGYLFDVPQMYRGSPTLPTEGMAIPTALADVALGIGLQLARPDRGLPALLLRADLGGAQSRRWLAGLAIVPVVIALLVLGQQQGLYGPAETAAAVTAVVLAFAVANLYLNGRHLSDVGATLDRALADAVATHAALEHSEARLRSLVDRAPDGLFVADLQGRYLEVNDAGCRIVRQDRSALIGRTIADFLPPEDVDRLWAVRERLLQGGSEVSEWHFRARDGRYTPIEVSTTILPDGRWQALVRDVTERIAAREAEARVREVEERARSELADLLEASRAITDAVVRMPETGLEPVLRTVIVEASRLTGARMGALGMGTEEGAPFDPWIEVGVDEAILRAIGRPPRVVGTLAVPILEGRSLRVDDVRSHPAFRGLPPGHPPVGSLLAVPIRAGAVHLGNLYLANKADGPFTEADQRSVEALAGRAVSAIQIARLYEAEALQRGWLESVLDQIPEPVVIADETGRPQRLNEAARALAVPGTAEVDAHPLHLRTPDGAELPPEEHPEVRAARSGEALVAVELVVVGPDGVDVPVLASAAPVRTGDAVRGAVVVLQDIRTIKELDRLREEWSAVVAHDLRQPATTIALTTELLLRRGEADLSPRVADGLRTISDASRQLRRLISDLLDVTRIEARRLTVKLQPVDLAPLVRRAIAHLEVTISDREVRVTTPDEVQVLADAGRVEQVLQNLLTNAVKYGSPGTPITLGVTGGDEEVTVAVTNLGAGILPEELPTLFTRFTRTGRALAAGMPGVGLGLFIAKGIVEAHGGRIGVRSEPGAATTFWFTLRRAGEDGDDA